MFHDNRWLNLLLSVAFVIAAGAGCGGTGCSGCTSEPLPEGGLPADQTVEGGAQVRITEQGFDTIAELVKALFEDQLGNGAFSQNKSDIFNAGPFGYACICGGTTCSSNENCPVNVSLDSIEMSVPKDDTLRITAQIDFDATLSAAAYIIELVEPPVSCVLTVSLQNTKISADIGFDIDPDTGELTIQFQDLNEADLSGASVTGCGGVGGVLNAVLGAFAEVLDILTLDILDPIVNPILGSIIEAVLEQMLPDPLGLEATYDLGGLLAGFSPSTQAKLETRMVPGGYAELEGGGLSLGIITGLNSDWNPATREPELDNEPHICVPPLSAIDFAADPHNLPTVPRINGNQFALAAANEFAGSPDPAHDIAMGMSETFLDLAGHHLVTSGAMCLNVSAASIPQFNLGTIGLLVPSFAELGSEDGKDPLLLVIRPQTAIDFRIGVGSEEDPSLNLGLQELEVDFYAFLYERWVRGFTISLTADVGINLEFTTDNDGTPGLLPVLSGLDASALEIKVLNGDFLRETPAELEAVFPALLDLALPLITDSLGAFSLPDFSGFTLNDMVMTKVITDEDEFLAIYGSLGATDAMIQAMEPIFPSFAESLANLSEPQPVPADTRAELLDVVTPAPSAVRSALTGNGGGALPHIIIDVADSDELGRQLEWTWNINGGMARPFTSQRPLIINDRALAMQGNYDIEVRSRVIGDYRTLDQSPVTIPVVIDSAGPRISKFLGMNVGSITVSATDLVSDDVSIAFGNDLVAGPMTEWSDGEISVVELANLVRADGSFTVWATDGNGNTSTTDFELDLRGPRTSTGGCSTGGSAASGLTLLFVGLLGWLLGGRRRRRRILALARNHMTTLGTVGAVLLFSMISPSCSCGADVADSCISNEDCIAVCGDGEIPLCTLTGQCLCADDIPYGRIGQFSSLALSPVDGSAWVSAYNATHGDLMVVNWNDAGRIPGDAWTFVDGVPDGPVDLPDSDIRGGISAGGDDVGLYTDISVADDGTVFVSYYDADRAALKLAALYDGVWESHIVHEGTPITANPENSFSIAGQYSSITLDRDGHPTIAYFSHFSTGGDVTTQVQYAAATVGRPHGSGDWNIVEIDSASVAPTSEGDLPLPDGVGLFIDAALQTTGEPVLAYYDRVNGDLKSARMVNGEWLEPEVLHGGEDIDVGWYPDVAVDGENNIHVSYVDVNQNDLLYINSIDLIPEIVDDGFRLVGTTTDGLPKPEFHFVGDDSALVIGAGGPWIAYQDATNHELLTATKDENGMWGHGIVAGDEAPFEGGFGFYAAAERDGAEVVVSSWVVDQPNFEAWVHIFRFNMLVE